MPIDPVETFCRTHASLLTRLHRDANVARWNVGTDTFGRTLHRSAERRFRDTQPRASDVASYLESLHLADLGLACACIDGNDGAWEHFIAQFRPQLRVAARAITNDGSAHDLADALYADLFGTTEQDGKRRSLLLYFHGRSSLSTWLRAVLAQRHIDVVRTRVRQAPLDDDQPSTSDEPPRRADRGATAPVGHDSSTLRLVAQLQVALKAVLKALEPGDRLRLASYYVQGMTLAQIGRMTGEHEATVSRKLDRLRRAIRTQVEQRLERAGLSDAERQECFDHAQDDWPFDLSAVLASADASRTDDCKITPPLRSKREDV